MKNKRSKILRKGILLLSIFCLVFPILTFAQKNIVGPPEDFEEMKEMGESFKEEAEEKALGIFARIWKEDVVPVWQKMWDCFSNWWSNSFTPFVKGIFGKISDFFTGKIRPSVEEEFEKRKPVIEEEFEKEKEEFKKEAPETSRSLWEKFMEIIK